MDNKPPKAILFDLDNTLYDYEVCNQAGQKTVLIWLSAKLGISVRRLNQMYKTARTTIHQQLSGQAASHSRLLYLKYVLEYCTAQTQTKLTLQAATIFWRAYFAQLKLRPGILPLLRYLQSKKIPLAIITDLTTELQLRKILQLHIEKYFTYIISSEEAGHDKPHSAIMNLVLKRLNISAQHTILIGDSISHDQAMAQHCQLTFWRLSTNADVPKITKKIRQCLK